MAKTTGNILTIDIGGSHVKATILNPQGVPVSDYARMPTPEPSTPLNVLDLIKQLVKNFTDYDKISVGFPGYVRDGVVKTDKDYDEYIGEKAYQKRGKEHWNYRMKKVFAIIKTVFNYDRLYISGGNAKNITFPLDDNMIIVNNREGIKGGARLWLNE